MNKTLLLLLIASLAMAMSSCRHKGFCYDHPHGDIYVEVEYDDYGDPDDTDHLAANVSATRLIAYHEATGTMVLASDIARTLNVLPLDPDKYHFIALNAGTEHITFSDRDSYYSHAATTRECDLLEPFYGSRVDSELDLGNDEAVVIAAEPLWSIGAEAVKCQHGDTVRLKAIPLHCRYTYEMRNIENLQTVVRVSSFITGMARGTDLGSTDLHDTPVTVAVPAEVNKERTAIVGSFMCFGQNPRIGARHRMGLFVELDNGKKYKLLEGSHFDVTDQVISAPNRRRVHIIIDGVRLPDPDVDAGFDVDVDPWGDGEDLDINFGSS